MADKPAYGFEQAAGVLLVGEIEEFLKERAPLLPPESTWKRIGKGVLFGMSQSPWAVGTYQALHPQSWNH